MTLNLSNNLLSKSDCFGRVGLLVLALNVVASTFVLAADKVETYTGYVVDRSCAAMIKNDHKDPTQRLKDHTKKCALDPTCCEAGYTVYSGVKVDRS